MYLPRVSLFLLFLSAPSSSFAPTQFRSRRAAAPLLAAEDAVAAAELDAKVQRLNGLLTTLERRSTRDRLEWMTERTTLSHKISVLKELLKDATPAPVQETVQALELQLTLAHDYEQELVDEQERLEREVGILQNQIVQIRMLLKTEENKSAELEEQWDQVMEEQESERMQYQIQVEAQTREIEAMRAKLQFYEQQQQYSTSTASYSRNGTLTMS